MAVGEETGKPGVFEEEPVNEKVPGTEDELEEGTLLPPTCEKLLAGGR